ncbi:DoxX family protein [Candidatus Spongiisocius sp.]|uniref:DoxX family protein n=1 Tax=Candidatus Spongiisocius sp. TaxID=3101273 RepID=UPI003B5934D3
MEVLVLIGRILFSLIFIGAGIGHLADPEGSARYAESRDAPSSGMVIRLSGVLIAAGGLGVILGVWMDLAALGLAVYCLLTALMVHHFWTDEASDLPLEMAMFMKNVSMAGAGLMIFALSAGGVDMGGQLVAPLFSL